jgi:hypothetical protein
MTVRPGKNFIVAVLAGFLAIGGLASVLTGNRQIKDVPPVQAQAVDATAGSTTQPVESTASQANPSGDYRSSGYEDGYRAGYRDAQQDCTTARPVARSYSGTRSYSGSRYYAPRRRVAGVRYVEPRRGHSTRNMILTIAAPAALGAGVGAIAGGKKGAGVGALLGGGGGALYYLLKHRR